MATFSAQLYDGVDAEAQQVTVEISNGLLRILGAGANGAQDGEFALASLRVSPRAGSAMRFINLPSGDQLGCPDCAELNRLPQADAVEGLVSWLDERWWVALIAVILTQVGLGASYWFGLPRLSELVASRVSLEQERGFGAGVRAAIDGSGLFFPSQLSNDQLADVRRAFKRVSDGLAIESAMNLEIRSAPEIGANAFALPGGTVLVTDGLVNLFQSQDELASVLAHEVGHLEKRHTLRTALQRAGFSVVAGAILGDLSSVVVFSSFPTLVASLKYSRAMETEADNFALSQLCSKGIAAETFAQALERVANQQNVQEDQVHTYLSTHPDPTLRVERARQFAQRIARAPSECNGLTSPH